jgi:putative phosphoesterase
MTVEKVAVVADVHANRYALQAFIAWLSRHPEIEQVWNLGDFLQQGPHPAEVVDLLLQDNRFMTILGNNEQTLLQREPAAFSANEVAHQDWTIAQVGQRRLAWISQLPDSLRVTMKGKQVLLIHEQPPLGEETRGLDLICCGHTHQPSYETLGTLGILNPGSLGFTRGHSLASFAVVTFSEHSARVQFSAIPYDRSALQQDYDDRQVPDRETLFALHGLEELHDSAD